MRNDDTGPVHEALLRSGLVAPVELGGAEERLWCDCDLASLAENRIGDTTNPGELDAERRAHWLDRATDERPSSLRSRDRFERCYWVLDGAERIGTVALTTTALGSASLHMSSFYVLPPLRGRGAGSRFLHRLKDVLARHEFGLRLDTSWCWQRAVHFYLREGMWIYMWKRDLTFCWYADLPRAQVSIGDAEATLSVPVDGHGVVLASARRRGDVLEFVHPGREAMEDPRLDPACYHASSTLALSLALHGWPLIQSQEEWEDGRGSDGGSPEGLAYKISIWEAWARKHDWQVPSVRIPGLEYPTWEELEARWAKAEREFEASLIRAKDT